MCGRFVQDLVVEEIYEFYGVVLPPRNIQPRYNIAPTQSVEVVIPGDKGNELVSMRWGLVPSWWKKPAKQTPAAFNARAETVAEKPFFRSAFKNKRCIIPASGFYECTGEKGNKQPYYISPAKGRVFSFAGLWDDWKDVESGDRVRSCTIIVTSANDALRPLHDRMPVLITPNQFALWLSGKGGTEMLKPAPNDSVQSWRVSSRVNATGKNDDKSLIEKVEA